MMLKKDDLVRINYSDLKDKSAPYMRLIKEATDKGIAKVYSVTNTSVNVYKPNTNSYMLGLVSVPIESITKI